MRHPSGNFPGGWFDAQPGPSAGSTSKQLMGFVILALLNRAWANYCSALEARLARNHWFPGLPTGHGAGPCQDHLGRGSEDLHFPRCGQAGGLGIREQDFLKEVKRTARDFLSSPGAPSLLVTQRRPVIRKTTARGNSSAG